ncbi:MAG: hypothetical protein OXH63_23240 [Gemmatimonadetes bacterium]|nr:hypothetical protein [Gemmatimonadota bacterium]
MRPLNAPAVVDVGPPIQVEVASAVTGTGQGTRLTDVQVVVSEGVGGTQAAGLAHEKVGRKGLLIDPDGDWHGAWPPAMAGPPVLASIVARKPALSPVLGSARECEDSLTFPLISGVAP